MVVSAASWEALETTLDGGDAADTLVGEQARIDTSWSAVQTL
jgi:hypothetical protein